MKILDWEKKIHSKYTFIKIDKEHKSQINEYRMWRRGDDDKVSIESITEGDINDEDFYASYVFNEEQIVGHQITHSMCDSGWLTTIVFIASNDGVNISDYFIHGPYGIRDEDLNDFCDFVNPLKK